jgi:uncharacterized protein YyaL (SSP411 family)
LRLLLRVWKRFNEDHALHMVRHTLDRMAMGGIYDHLGGGFARYSTDARWFAPHFEKMLYDNALLVPCYVEAYLATGEPFYRQIVEETLAWVKREMTSPEGPFYSTLDADSEGHEGKFYTWTAAEIEKVLGEQDAATFNAVYGVEPEGNWENGWNILYRAKTFDQFARMNHIPEPELKSLLAECRKKLFAIREGRIRPGRDEKVLTAWNGLMIGALADAAAALDLPEYAEAGARAADFILRRMRTPDRLLLRTYSTGSEPKLNAYLEDYAYLLDGLVSLYEATFEPRWIADALDLSRVLIEQFWDEAGGGFFYTGRDHEALISRAKDPHDNATPSGNGVAAYALQRLGHLLGEPRYLEAAARALQAFKPMLERQASGHTSLCLALEEQLAPPTVVILRGGDLVVWQRELAAHYLPQTMVLAIPAGISALPSVLDKPAGTKVNAWVCQGVKCLPPITELAELVAAVTNPAA